MKQLSEALANGGSLGRDDAAALRQCLQVLDSCESALTVTRVGVSGLVRSSGAWRGDGAYRNHDDWRANRSRQGMGAARAEQETEAALEALPGLGQAAAAGDVTAGHVKVVAGVLSGVSEETRKRLAQEEERILKTAATQSVPNLRRSLRAMAAAMEADKADAAFEVAHRQRFLRLITQAGMVRVEGALDPVAGASVRAALEAVTPVPSIVDVRSAGQRMADALTTLAGRVLAVGDDRAGSQIRPHLNLLVREDTWLLLTLRRRAALSCLQETLKDHAGDPGGDTAGAAAGDSGVSVGAGRGGVVTGKASLTAQAQRASGMSQEPPLAQLLDGTLIPFGALDVLACDATMQRVVLDASGEPLDIGRAERTFTKDLRRAVLVRDRHCQWPGCSLRASWCEVHHIQHWSHGGATSHKNGITLCNFHHHTVHAELIAIHRIPGGFRFIRSDGTRIGATSRLDDDLLVPSASRTPSSASGTAGAHPRDPSLDAGSSPPRPTPGDPGEEPSPTRGGSPPGHPSADLPLATRGGSPPGHPSAELPAPTRGSSPPRTQSARRASSASSRGGSLPRQGSGPVGRDDTRRPESRTTGNKGQVPVGGSSATSMRPDVAAPGAPGETEPPPGCPDALW